MENNRAFYQTHKYEQSELKTVKPEKPFKE